MSPLLNLLGVRRPPPRRDMNLQGVRWPVHRRCKANEGAVFTHPLEPPRGDMNIQGVAIEPLFTQSEVVPFGSEGVASAMHRDMNIQGVASEPLVYSQPIPLSPKGPVHRRCKG